MPIQMSPELIAWLRTKSNARKLAAFGVKAWDESAHQRGQPDNAGQFGPGGNQSGDSNKPSGATSNAGSKPSG